MCLPAALVKAEWAGGGDGFCHAGLKRAAHGGFLETVCVLLQTQHTLKFTCVLLQDKVCVQQRTVQQATVH